MKNDNNTNDDNDENNNNYNISNNNYDNDNTNKLNIDSVYAKPENAVPTRSPEKKQKKTKAIQYTFLPSATKRRKSRNITSSHSADSFYVRQK